jgi:putative addiction module component
MTKPELFAAARALSPEERAELLAVLAESLDEELSEDQIKTLWVEEAARRAQEIIDGTAEEIPGDEVMAQARALLA